MPTREERAERVKLVLISEAFSNAHKNRINREFGSIPIEKILVPF